MKLKEIEVGKFRKINGRSEPYCIFFVYTPKENFVLKGMYDECKQYIEQRYVRYIARYTMWKDGKNRGSWIACKDMYIRPYREGQLDDFGFVDGRVKYKVTIYHSSKKTWSEFKFRRLPKKWLPVYDEAFKL